jgi:hypothetical protein
MLIVKIDVVRLEPHQRFVGNLPDVFWPAVPPSNLGRGSYSKPNLVAMITLSRMGARPSPYQRR